MKPIMLAGTGSDVGKSIIATALCRIFLQDGYHPAPFKAQNMALNSYATADGREIGRAQAVQAEAARVPCHTDMNPLLLKPNSEHTTQVVLNGKPIGNRSAYDYFRKEGREELRREVCDAFDRLSRRYNPIVMEGAGSISEINLRDSDLVNMPMARHADAKVILVADIDRGGVFASAYGSIMLQTPDDRKRIAGIIVNKFRGDLRLFDKGRQMLEDICGVPVLGVVPMFKDIVIDQEDSYGFLERTEVRKDGNTEIRNHGITETRNHGNPEIRNSVIPELRNSITSVAVVLLRHISNFTDFNILQRDSRVNLFYSNNPKEVADADIIILPGTKATLDDMLELRRNGVAQAVLRAHHDGKTIVGICGGYQMLGQTISDPDGVEGDIPQLPGLGLLDTTTVMTADKTTCQVQFDFNGNQCQGYEIHQGVTCGMDGTPVKEQVLIASADGKQGGMVLGTYIHGILDNQPVIDYILHDSTASTQPVMSMAEFKDQQYDLLASHVRKYIDMERLYDILKTR